MNRPRRCVLVVEDNIDGAMSLVMLVKQMGHQVEYVASGDAAVVAARRIRPDTVFLDIGLRGEMDGFEVAKQLRADFGGAIRIIAITAYGTEAERQRGIEAGIDLHLLKPARTELLESLLG